MEVSILKELFLPVFVALDIAYHKIIRSCFGIRR